MNTYDIIVIGAGAGGLSVAAFMAKAGFKTLIIDKSEKTLGGDCLNAGCVPSKALIHVSRLVHDAHQSSQFGLSVKGKVDLKKVAKYIKDKQNVIRVHETSKALRKRGMDVVLGTAAFHSENSVKVGNNIYTAKKIVIATGSRPRALKIPGIEKVKYHTNETIFENKKLPGKLLIIGGGPIGLEIGQAYQRLGSQVTVVQRGSQFLPRELPEMAKVLEEQLKKEGMEFLFNANPLKFSSANTLVVKLKNGKTKSVKFDAVLIAIGRQLNFEKLNLEKAGIALTEDGRKIKVNDFLQTTNKHVFVCGDIAGSYQFTHVAGLHAGIVINNFFSPMKKKANYDHLSWVTFTDPEIANFGLNPKQLSERGIDYETLSITFDQDDRAIVDEATQGRLVVYVQKDKILGGSMVAKHAGELVQELILANSSGIGLKAIFNKTYPYPTATQIHKKLVSQHFGKKLTTTSKKILGFMYKLK